ncbi:MULTISPECIES: CitMHS family transporter [Rhodococcus]|uniref:Magnesium citrate transporter CitM n=1 Tax=Rhodococcus opacus TaxID=37919 RepID=A0A1B1JZV6_RHOOP|nr:MULTISPECIES: SLC13 family permease [Rhodococcus]ANS25904.1 magnesium citrate transporter CitM [Rhodococcus opacus]MDI9937271.1 SLC13 family permease [Rhodococcus sp. IEGM 1351]MDV6242571.1 SLC13 family permease [Rhodococcus opacus]QDQ90614.1 citrate:proton symporter [Rhodococcus sp. WB9]UNN03908.1 citrate:proton symporter [Rhodococcus opacus]
MLVALGFLMVAVFMFLIMSKRATPVVGLIAVPVAFGIAAGAGLGIGDMITDGIKALAPTAALLFFAIIFFGIMIDVGLFDPLVKLILRLVRNDPMRLVVGTAVLAMVVSLDGDGSTTFIIVTSALLPLYMKLKVSPVVLTVVAGLANGAMNIVPWGGPTVRAAAALGISPSDVFVPMIPSLVVGLLVVLLFAVQLGYSERRRIGTLELTDERLLVSAGSGLRRSVTGSGSGSGGNGDAPRTGGGSGDAGSDDGQGFVDGLDPQRPTLRPKLLWFNALVTVALLVVLVMDVLPIPVLFMVAASIALTVNFPRVKEQQEAITRHSSSIVSVVAMVFAAAVLTGVFQGTGMVEAMAQWLLEIIPASLGPHLAVITGILSLPFTFFMSNDAFYFGIMPVLAETAATYGIEPVEMARASITGQTFHMQSPLVPAILLLVTLAGVPLADHHKKVLWRAALVSLSMLVIGVVLGQIPW